MDSNRLAASLQNAAEIIRKAHYAVALTGAGISTPSGIPDFRSRGSGLWERYAPMEVASLTKFRQHPARFFEWLRPLAQQMLCAEPNPAHFALAQLETQKRLHTLITQNFDGLHQCAGTRNLLQVHGTLNTLTCIGCYQQVDAQGYTAAFLDAAEIPYCDTCGNILKPDVVLFEEQLPAKIWLKARRAAQACDLMIVAGTSLVVSPVAQLPEQARNNGAHIIIINKSPTYMDEFANVVIHGDTAEILPEITMKVLDE